MEPTAVAASLLDLPDLVLDNIVCRLALRDRKQLRLACRRINNAISTLIYKKTKVDLNKIAREDVGFVDTFIAATNFGKYMEFEAVDEGNTLILSDIFKKLDQLQSFSGCLSFIDLLSLFCCTSIKSLILISPSMYNRNGDGSYTEMFVSYMEELKSFKNLTQLTIEFDGKLPISSLCCILDNTPSLTTLSLYRVQFTRDEDIVLKPVIINKRMEMVLHLKTQIQRWIFREVSIIGLYIFLPTTSKLIDMCSSVNITWDQTTTQLEMFKTDYSRKQDMMGLFPINVEELSLNIDGLILTNLEVDPAIRGSKEYTSLTVETYMTSKAMQNILSIVSMKYLTKIHLINSDRIPWVFNETFLYWKCTEQDILSVCQYFKHLSVLGLENFDNMSFGLVQDLSGMDSIKLQLLRFINCKSFSSSQTSIYKHLKFHVDVW